MWRDVAACVVRGSACLKEPPARARGCFACACARAVCARVSAGGARVVARRPHRSELACAEVRERGQDGDSGGGGDNHGGVLPPEGEQRGPVLCAGSAEWRRVGGRAVGGLIGWGE